MLIWADLKADRCFQVAGVIYEEELENLERAVDSYVPVHDAFERCGAHHVAAQSAERAATLLVKIDNIESALSWMRKAEQSHSKKMKNYTEASQFWRKVTVWAEESEEYSTSAALWRTIGEMHALK